jgi:hypothetical protein
MHKGNPNTARAPANPADDEYASQRELVEESSSTSSMAPKDLDASTHGPSPTVITVHQSLCDLVARAQTREFPAFGHKSDACAALLSDLSSDSAQSATIWPSPTPLVQQGEDREQAVSRHGEHQRNV